MAKVPGQRKPGQTGGGGRIGQTGNRVRSGQRGGRPHAGGGGTGSKPPGDGCKKTAVVIGVVGLGVVGSLVSAAGYGVWQLVT